MSKSHVSRVRELYKLILRVHRSLPDDLKILGDNYAREEFKRHKKCKPQEAQIFLNEWREYVGSMTRQAAPARAERRPPADRKQNGTSRKVRAADQRQAAKRDVVATAGTHPRFGNDLNEEHIEQLSPEQLINLFRLLITTRAEGTQAEYANEPIDIGIELTEADVLSKLTEDAKKEILKMDSEEIRKLIRAEIQEHNILLNKNFWYEVLGDAQTVKDFEEFRLSAKGARIGEDEAKKARLAAGVAEKKSEDAEKTAAATETLQGKK